MTSAIVKRIKSCRKNIFPKWTRYRRTDFLSLRQNLRRWHIVELFTIASIYNPIEYSRCYMGDFVDSSQTYGKGITRDRNRQRERGGGERQKLVSPTGSALITQEHEDELWQPVSQPLWWVAIAWATYAIVQTMQPNIFYQHRPYHPPRYSSLQGDYHARYTLVIYTLARILPFLEIVPTAKWLHLARYAHGRIAESSRKVTRHSALLNRSQLFQAA